jgi:hypothetical protein
VVQLYREISEVARNVAEPRINRYEQLIEEGAKRASRRGARKATGPHVPNNMSRSMVQARVDAGKLPHRR